MDKISIAEYDRFIKQLGDIQDIAYQKALDLGVIEEADRMSIREMDDEGVHFNREPETLYDGDIGRYAILRKEDLCE